MAYRGGKAGETLRGATQLCHRPCGADGDWHRHLSHGEDTE